MFPSLFEFSGVQVTYLGVFSGLSVFVLYLYLLANIKYLPYKMKGSEIADMIVLTGVGCLIGARSLHVVINLDYYRKPSLPISEWVAIWHGGLSHAGAMIGGVLMLALFCRFTGKRLIPMLDYMSPGILGAHVIINIGCFLNGDLPGKPSEINWGLDERVTEFFGKSTTTPIHPVMIYEAIILFAGFIILYLLRTEKFRHGFKISVFLLVLSLDRFIISLLKQESSIWNLYITHFLSIVGFSLALSFLIGMRLYYKDGTWSESAGVQIDSD